MGLEPSEEAHTWLHTVCSVVEPDVRYRIHNSPPTCPSLDLWNPFILVINQLDAQNFCFTISLFHASTRFEHMCSPSGGQNCIIQPLVSSHL